MRFFILALALGCLTSDSIWGADKPLVLNLERMTTLHVGQLALLQTPLDPHYPRFSAAGDALVVVRHSQHKILFRAIRPGRETIVISPDVPQGHCISCVTLHYFITVIRNK